MKRILFVDHTPFIGGAQLVLVEHIAVLNKEQFDPHVACSDDMPELVNRFGQAGAVVHTLPMGRLRGNPLQGAWRLLRASWQLRQLIKQQHIDLVVTNTTRASYIASLAVLGTRTPSIWYVRDFLYPLRLFHLLQFVPKKIIAVSKAVVEQYMSLTDPKAAVLYVASNIYQQLPTISKDQIMSERQKYGFKDGDIVVGFMGRLVAEKGAQDLLAAVAELSKNQPKLRLLIVGTGQGQEHDIEAQLHQVVYERGLQEIVQFAGYQINQALYYSLFDIFVLATRDREPYATSVVQAMMANLPVIGTNAGGTPELVVDQQTGLLYAPGDVTALCAAIELLITDQTLAESLAKTGQQQVLQYNTEEVVTGQAEIIYQQVTG